MIQGELRGEKHELNDSKRFNVEKSRSHWNIIGASSEALRSSWGDGSLHGDLAAKKGPKHVETVWMVLGAEGAG